MRSSTRTRPTWWWRSRSRAPTRARSSDTPIWGCGSSGCCEIRKVPALRVQSSSPCVPRTAPRRLASSAVLRGLSPDDICEAIVGVRLSVTRDERTEAVARIVRRRQRASVRVRGSGHAVRGAFGLSTGRVCGSFAIRSRAHGDAADLAHPRVDTGAIMIRTMSDRFRACLDSGFTRRRFGGTCLVLALAATAIAGVPAAAEQAPGAAGESPAAALHAEAAPFFAEHCVICHGNRLSTVNLNPGEACGRHRSAGACRRNGRRRWRLRSADRHLVPRARQAERRADAAPGTAPAG